MKAFRDTSTPCKNKDLAGRNKILLHPQNEIPVSAWSTELKSFEQQRRTAINEIYPMEKRTHIPGRVIHLVHDLDRSGRFVPYWESSLSQSLRDIDLTLEVFVSLSSSRVQFVQSCSLVTD